MLQLFAREQILGEDQRPLVVKKGKKLKDDHPKREVPPDAPIIDVSWDNSMLFGHRCPIICLSYLFLLGIARLHCYWPCSPEALYCNTVGIKPLIIMI